MEPATIAAVVIPILLATSGFLYKRYRDLKKEIGKLEQDVDDAHQRTEKVMSILFGSDDDETDEGMTQEVENSFDELVAEIDDIDEDVDDLDGAVSVIIIKLDKDDSVDFDRDNLSYEAELSKLK